MVPGANTQKNRTTPHLYEIIREDATQPMIASQTFTGPRHITANQYTTYTIWAWHVHARGYVVGKY